MLLKLLTILSLTLFMSSCKTIAIEDEYEQEIPLAIIEEQPQEEQEFDIMDAEEVEEINEAVQQEIEEEIEEIEVIDRILFALDSSNLSKEAVEILEVQAAWLQNDPSINIVIEGHCDERGTREYNIALGERRAQAVKNFLVERGSDSSRIKTVSYGKERPAFVGTGGMIWSKNRRSVTVVEE